VELFRNPNIDFVGKRNLFFAISAVMLLISLGAIFLRGIPLGVDFKGGTLVYVKFTHATNEDEIRKKMDAANLSNTRIQRYGAPDNNEVLIALEQSETSEAALDQGKNSIVQALNGGQTFSKPDFNNVGMQAVKDALLRTDPLLAGTAAPERYQQVAEAIMDYRDVTKKGAIGSLDELKSVADAKVVETLKAEFQLSDFAVRNVEIVGPQVGSQLRNQALLASLYALVGMLIYLWFRFEFIYGAAAVAAVFHDTIITLGAFSLLNKEVSLTVVAALLTLIGYSMNDTIVIFDRIREDLRLRRREDYPTLVNKAVNETLSRTVLTSGLTFLTVLCLWLFGGEVLNGFSFALVVGILLGTYSSFGTAVPLLVVYQQSKASNTGRTPAAAPAAR
jgi:preprotein translocase subunit SecF